MTFRPVKSATRERTALIFKNTMHHDWEERNRGYQAINPEVVCSVYEFLFIKVI